MSSNQTPEAQPPTSPTDINAVSSQHSSVRNVPAEIVDLVVEELETWIKSLSWVQEHCVSSCLAYLLSVSRAFRYSARKRIFREVEIGYVHPHKRGEIALLHHILNGDPSIQRHIKKLTIIFYPNNSPQADRGSNLPPKFDDESNCADFISLLHHFSKAPITHVLVGGRRCVDFYLDRFGPSGMEAFMALRCNPHIVSFVFEKLDKAPSMLITGNPSTDTLPNLQLYDTHFLGSGSKVATFPFTEDSVDAPPFVQKILRQPQQFPFQNLRLLVLDRPSRFPLGSCRSVEETDAVDKVTEIAVTPTHKRGDFPSPDFVFRSLEILVVGYSRANPAFRWQVKDNDYMAIGELVKRAPKLLTLDLVYPLSLRNNDESPQQCRFLEHANKRLEFRMINISCDASGYTTIAAAARLIEYNLPLDNVEIVSLTVLWNCRGEDQLPPLLKPSEGWEALVSALNKVHSLRTFTLYVAFWMPMPPRSLWLRDFALERLVEVSVKEHLKGLRKGIQVDTVDVRHVLSTMYYIMPTV